MANSRICSVDGCGKKHFGKGFCNAHYALNKRHGDPLGGRIPPGETSRFFREVVLEYTGDDCLPWPYAKSGKGYGVMNVDGKQREVHRYVCEIVNGLPPTPLHDAAHSCGKGHEACVTKGHLSWKTKKENHADRFEHGTHHRGEKHNLSKLTDEDIKEIRRLRGVAPQQEVANRFGVTQGHISGIQSGRCWPHI